MSTEVEAEEEEVAEDEVGVEVQEEIGHRGKHMVMDKGKLKITKIDQAKDHQGASEGDSERGEVVLEIGIDLVVKDRDLETGRRRGKALVVKGAMNDEALVPRLM